MSKLIVKVNDKLSYKDEIVTVTKISAKGIITVSYKYGKKEFNAFGWPHNDSDRLNRNHLTALK